MSLPAHFIFTQSNLQDFAECRRRFQLRYLDRLAWPAIESEPALENELRLNDGNRFHRFVHQHQIGIPGENISRMAQEAGLSVWWQNYLANQPVGVPEQRWPEFAISSPFEGYRLSAKYDLLAVAPGERMVIVDWKTSIRQPKREWLTERLQTRVYPFLLVEAGATLNGGREVHPDQIEMIYWYAEFPGQEIRFPYSASQYRQDREVLAGLIGTIARLAVDEFPLTTDKRRCLFCPYRSLCDRGGSAGEAADWEDRWEGDQGDAPLEQITETEF